MPDPNSFDRYPGARYDACAKALSARRGVSIEEYDLDGAVLLVVTKPIPGRLRLTWQQVKFAVMRPVSNEDLVNEIFPADWPPNVPAINS